jgi:phenylalanine-4-hydroxylase
MRSFTPEEHETWRRLYDRLTACRATQAHPLFVQGLQALGIGGDAIASLDAVNQRLGRRTGFRGVAVKGLEGPREFFAGLARREFPVGDFIRDAKDLSYTPAPDVFHDLYGHLPLLADAAYADFCQRFGVLASAAADDPERLREFERLFWFGVEFPLVETAAGRRIFGGGILSSAGESSYALSEAPEVLPFDVEAIRRQEFRIDVMQARLFVLREPAQLYACLDEF